MTTHAGFDQASFDNFVESRGEPNWLSDQRRRAWAGYLEKAWPSRNEEEWRRTDIRLFRLDSYHLTLDTPNLSSPSQALLNKGIELAGQSVAINSRPRDVHLDEKWSQRGVLFGSLDELVHEHGDLIQRHLFQKAVDPQYDRFAALHAAFWSGGHFLYVPRNVVIDEPLHTLSMLGDNGVDLGHTLVILDEGAEATLLSETENVGKEDGGLHCGGVELLLAPRAHLRYVSLQNWAQGVWHFAHQQALVDRDASLQWTIGAMGGKLAKVNQHVTLVGEGANCQVNGVMFTEGKQHFAYHTLQHHQSLHTQSDFLYKVALQDRSRTVWRGMIKVDAAAQKTNGYQRNDNLLLSSQARADSIPGLEIEADDVRCTHGATSGRVDEEMIFYACARAFTRKEAIQMIVTGFFQQVFDRITIESVRDALSTAIAQRVREYE
ncbi:MAG: Fe-S cluster assembly protein SufD [Pirellulaceae bacterium]